MLRIFIPEIIPSLNKGEEAIFRGILKTLPSDEGYEVSLYSIHPEVDRLRYDFPGVQIVAGDGLIIYNSSKASKLIKFPWILLKHMVFLVLYKLLGKKAALIMRGDLWRAYQEADIIIAGHDNAFSKFHVPLILFSKLLGKPTIIYGASMLPWAHANALNKALVKFCLEKVDLITLREEISKQLVDDLGVKNRAVYVTADKAFLLDPASNERVKSIMQKEGIRKRAGEALVGMTAVYGSEVFAYAFPDIEELQQKYDKHVQILADLADDLVEKLDATVMFLPHAIGFGTFNDKYDDRIVARDIFKAARNKERIVAIENEYPVDELKGLIGQCDLFIGERTHSVIGAMSMGVPSIVITSPKDYRTQGIIGRMLAQQKWVYNCENMSTETLIAKAHELWAERDEVRHDLVRRCADAKSRSLRNGELLRKLISEKLPGKTEDAQSISLLGHKAKLEGDINES